MKPVASPSKGWSVQLHHDNVVALAETRPDLKPVPSYPTLRRVIGGLSNLSDLMLPTGNSGRGAARLLNNFTSR